MEERQRGRSIEERLRRLERAWARIRPALEFYELMERKGLNASLPKMLEDYQESEAVREYLTGKRKLWRSRWVLILAFFGAFIPLVGLGIGVFNAVRLAAAGH